MRIAEVLSDESACGGSNSTAHVIETMEKLVAQAEQLVPMASPENTKNLMDCMTRLIPRRAFLQEDQKLQLWKLSYRLWNACVDMANSVQPSQQIDEDHVKLRQFASDLLVVAGKIEGIPSTQLKSASFFHRTGILWHKIRKFELAASCFEKATELISQNGEESLDEPNFLFELQIARAKTAWEMSQRTLTCTLLGRAKGLLFDVAGRYRELAEQYLQYGRCLLAKTEESGNGSNQSDFVKFLNQAFEICSEGLFKAVGKAEERGLLANLKLKTLRYLAAAHLQAESFESVLKCVAVLKEESDHPTTPFLALKAYIGLGLREEAEKELNALLVHGGAPLDICISAVEIFIQSGSGGLDAARNAFFRLLGRFPHGKELPVRVLDKILKNICASDQSCDGRVALALQIACDEKVIRLLADSEESSKSENERRCVHAILWNSASEFFRAKLYETSIRLFEASMLYIPLDAESIICRAKSLRVLCLSHLGLSQYDRADEYITEAEKLQPSIICAFLKFKICLQLKDEASATKQLDRMLCCIDFDAEYLTLASHEAIACKSIGVATAALSNLLKLYSTGKSISTREVVVVRNIILLHLDDHRSLSEALKFIKYAKKRMVESGTEQFFGSGIVAEKELNWLAGSSWNSGLKAGKSNNFELAAECFECAADFYGALEDSVDNLKMLSKSLLLSIASFLANSQNKDHSFSTEATGHLEKARKVLANLASKKEKPDESLQVYCTVLEFEMRGRMRDHKLQLRILNELTNLSGCKPEFLLKMGLHACEGEYANPEIAKAALSSCLNMVLSSPFPDYKMVSLVIRKLVGIADARGEEEECLGAYKQAHQIIIGMKGGEYPTEEAKWLVSTAWNRSGIHVRFNRCDEAEKWMRMALDLAKHVPSMQHRYGSSMADCLAKLVSPRTTYDDL